MKRLGLILLLAACAFAQKPPKPPKPGLYAVFNTDLGAFKMLLHEKETPVTVNVFSGLVLGSRAWRDPDGKMVNKPFYNGQTFFRVIEGAIQTGSPTGSTSYNCGLALPDEILPGYLFGAGTVAIANGGPDTGSCQFFITTGAHQTWNGKYTVFGQVVEGMDVVEKIARGKVRGETPLSPVKIDTVTLERVGPAPKVKK